VQGQCPTLEKDDNPFNSMDIFQEQTCFEHIKTAQPKLRTKRSIILSSAGNGPEKPMQPQLTKATMVALFISSRAA
jgi:hypothetical protein